MNCEQRLVLASRFTICCRSVSRRMKEPTPPSNEHAAIYSLPVSLNIGVTLRTLSRARVVTESTFERPQLRVEQFAATLDKKCATVQCILAQREPAFSALEGRRQYAEGEFGGNFKHHTPGVARLYRASRFGNGPPAGASAKPGADIAGAGGRWRVFRGETCRRNVLWGLLGPTRCHSAPLSCRIVE